MTVELNEFSSLNEMPADLIGEALFRCSGSSIWTSAMIAGRPFVDNNDLHLKANKSWELLTKADWFEAFKIHPRIGDLESLRQKFSSTAVWASHEQSGTGEADEKTIVMLAQGNADYEKRFGYIFIVCASGKSAVEMLNILTRRLTNDAQSEFLIACEEQKKITNLRLDKIQK